MSDAVTLWPFAAEHIPGALALSKAAGWVHRAEDWRAHLRVSSGVAALRKGTVLGAALRTSCGPELHVIGMVLVAKAERGRGLARRMMSELLAAPGTHRLAATPEGLPLYRKLGFVETGQLHQFLGPAPQGIPPDPGIRDMQPHEAAQVAALETAAFGADRSALVGWLAQSARILVAHQQAQVTGFAAVRRFGLGGAIGPVCAPDQATAQRLIAQAAAISGGHILRIDTDPRSALGPWLQSHLGLRHVGGGVSMQLGLAPAPPPRYALCSQALG